MQIGALESDFLSPQQRKQLIDGNLVASNPSEVPKPSQPAQPLPKAPQPPPPQPKDTPQLKEARYFLADARKFLASQETVRNISDIANQAAALQIALDNFDDSAAAKARQKLADLLDTMSGFKEFEQGEQDARKTRADLELADAKKLGAKNIFFIDYYLKDHLGDPSTVPLNTLRSQVDASIKKGAFDEMTKANNAVEDYVQKNKLSEVYREASSKFNDQTRGPIGTVADRLGIKEKSQFIIDGPSEDIVLLYNSSKDSPNVRLNVQGDIVFQHNAAFVCFAQTNPDPTMVRYVERRLRGDGANDLTPAAPPCDLSRASTSIDIVAFQRSGFLDGSTEYNRTLVKLVEDETLRKYQIVTDYPTEIQKRQTFARQIETDVEKEERKGFGVISVADSSSACVIAPQDTDTMDGIKELMKENRDLIAPRLLADWAFSDSSTADIAFLNIQKQYCGYVVGGATDLRVIMQALQRDNRPYKFAAIWWSGKDVKQAADDAHAQIHRKDEASNKGKDDQTLKNLRDNRKQEELRAKYGVKARGLRNTLRDIVTAMAESRPNQDADLFPSYSSWLMDRFAERWETKGVNIELEDFGTVQWQNRTLDAIIVSSTIDQINPVLGKYDHPCHMFGLVEDAEFSMWRNPLAVECSDESGVRKWKIRQGFRSEWNVPTAAAP